MPLYEEILKYNQGESHWHADETRWCRMIDEEGKDRRLHWMWVFVGKKSVVYVLDSTRSKSVPEKHFKNTEKGILNVDRYASYNVVSDKISLAYCWYHLRRDFINVGKKYKSLSDWAISWVLKIRDIERINRKRVALYEQGLPFDDFQNRIVQEVSSFLHDAENSIANDYLNKDQIRVLKSMLVRRDGYTVSLDFGQIEFLTPVQIGIKISLI